jgi:hypothetical protein
VTEAAFCLLIAPGVGDNDATTAVFIAAAIMDHGEGVTVIDVGALLVTSILAGLFLDFALRHPRATP